MVRHKFGFQYFKNVGAGFAIGGARHVMKLVDLIVSKTKGKIVITSATNK